MLDQMQVTLPDIALAALLAHPEFQAGLAEAQAAFVSEYEPAPLTQVEMIDAVEQWISSTGFELEQTVSRIEGATLHSYLYCLGFVVGTIDQGLHYAH